MSQLMSMTDLEIPASEFTPSMVMDLLIDHAHELWIDLGPPDSTAEYLRGAGRTGRLGLIGPPGRGREPQPPKPKVAMSMCEDIIRYGRRK